VAGGWRGRSEPVRQCGESASGLSELESAQMRAHKPRKQRESDRAWLQRRTVRLHFAVTHCLIQSNLLLLVLFTQSPAGTPSSVGITLDLYSHVLPGMQEDAAAKVDATIRAALDKA